jgi:arginine/lysine/ornithine decarboxylase
MLIESKKGGGYAMDMPVLEGLIKYAQEKNISFHMPGHKSNIRNFQELETIRKYFYKIDLTEVPGVDNLHCPEDIILQGEKLAARAFGAYKSYFLVNGSTCGIYSMIMGTTKPGDKIIVQRNCHRSVYMACLMGGLETVYITPEVIPDFCIPGGLSLSQIKKTIEGNKDAKAVVVTYPSYYGICSDLKAIADLAHKHNMLLLVDEAHGAHFGFSGEVPRAALSLGADVSVISLHKSTPAMTQCSLLNTSEGVDHEGISFMLRVFQSTSPSYILMASIDAARHIMESRGEELIDELMENINTFRGKAQSLQGFKLIDKSLIGKYSIHDVDLTKLVIVSHMGGRKLEEVLRKAYGIQVEMSDLNNAVLIGTVGDTSESYNSLYNALRALDGTGGQDYFSVKPQVQMEYVQAINMREAYYRPKERVRLKDAAGRISCELAAPYPPGIPVLLPGEVITREIIDFITRQLEYGIPINGFDDNTGEYISVIK